MLKKRRPKDPTNANDVAIGKRISAVRKSLGLTQSDLGAQLNVTFQQIQKYETGKNRVAVTKLIELAEILNVTLSDLLPAPGGDATSMLAEMDRETVRLVRTFQGIKDEATRKSILKIVSAFQHRE